MTRLVPKNEEVLRAVLKLTKATSQDVEDLLGYAAIPAIKSLHSCGLLETIATVRRTTKVGHSRDMHVYAVTEKGRQKLQDADFPPARQMQALKVPMKSPPPPKDTQQLHQMQSFIIQMPSKGHRVMLAEIDGREVKMTYGAGFEYEHYRPAPDRSRNYTPNPIRSMTSME